MEISGVLGDHSYVCARHFRPEDIIVHPNVCRLTANAVPSIFRNYPINLPRQFFKKICQTAATMKEEPAKSDDMKVEECCEMALSDAIAVDELDSSAQEHLNSILSSPSRALLEDEEIFVSDSQSQTESGDEYQNSSAAPKFSSLSNPSMSTAKMRKRLRTLELQHRQMSRKVEELQSKLDLYNISALERDAANNNEEASFLLDMLRTYAEFEKTRNEILSSTNDSLT